MIVEPKTSGTKLGYSMPKSYNDPFAIAKLVGPVKGSCLMSEKKRQQLRKKRKRK